MWRCRLTASSGSQSPPWKKKSSVAGRLDRSPCGTKSVPSGNGKRSPGGETLVRRGWVRVCSTIGEGFCAEADGACDGGFFAAPGACASCAGGASASATQRLEQQEMMREMLRIRFAFSLSGMEALACEPKPQPSSRQIHLTGYRMQGCKILCARHTTGVQSANRGG